MPGLTYEIQDIEADTYNSTTQQNTQEYVRSHTL